MRGCARTRPTSRDPRPPGTGPTASAPPARPAGLAGPTARLRGTPEPRRRLDITPTVLQAAGLPASRERGRGGAGAPAGRGRGAIDRAGRTRGATSASRPRPWCFPADAGRARAAGGARLRRRTQLPRAPEPRRGAVPQGRHRRAERELRQVVDEQPGNLSAWLWLAKAVAAQGRTRSALDVYERALALPGDRGRARRGRGARRRRAAGRTRPTDGLLALGATGRRGAARGAGLGRAARGPDSRRGRAGVAGSPPATRRTGPRSSGCRTCSSARAARTTALPALRTSGTGPRPAVSPVPRAARAGALLASGDAPGAEAYARRARRSPRTPRRARVGLSRGAARSRGSRPRRSRSSSGCHPRSRRLAARCRARRARRVAGGRAGVPGGSRLRAALARTC